MKAFVAENQNLIQEYEQVAKALKVVEAKAEELKAAILAKMEACGEKNFATDSIFVEYIAATTATSFDSAAFKKDNPEIAARYQKTSTKKAYIKTKVL